MEQGYLVHGWNAAASKEAQSRDGEFGRLLLVAVKKYPEVYAEFLRLAAKEEAEREARMGCERCRGKKVMEND